MKTDTPPRLAARDGVWQHSASDKGRRWRFVVVTLGVFMWLGFLHHRFNERSIPSKKPYPEDLDMSIQAKPFDWSQVSYISTSSILVHAFVFLFSRHASKFRVHQGGSSSRLRRIMPMITTASYDRLDALPLPRLTWPKVPSLNLRKIL